MKFSRESSTKRGYNYKWQKARAEFIHDHPLCAHCVKRSILTPAEVVDHINPHKGDIVLFWDRSKWQSLCKQCHDIKTATEDGGFGHEAKPVVRCECGVDGLPLDEKHHWNK
ncbi:MAG: HNH endonuclease [Proteobacteria bacterium]|nr:HNH endonuclease [Pseudomonadota bacterium]